MHFRQDCLDFGGACSVCHFESCFAVHLLIIVFGHLSKKNSPKKGCVRFVQEACSQICGLEQTGLVSFELLHATILCCALEALADGQQHVTFVSLGGTMQHLLCISEGVDSLPHFTESFVEILLLFVPHVLRCVKIIHHF